MKRAAVMLVLAGALASLLAMAASSPLALPHGQPGRQATAWGASAVWQGRGQPWFAIRSMADLVQGSGTLQRVPYDPSRTGRGEPLWDAAQQLAQTDPAERQIYTRDAASGQTVAFSWDSLPGALREALDADGLGQARTSFLRGVRTLEAGQPDGVFRRRAGVLGDIVRSIPLIVGPPVASAAQWPGQRAFAEQYAGREMAVYAGANDGMLHAFSARTGRELFAYMPSALHGRLEELADPAYRPRAWVDGSASQRDVDLAGRWRTVLASGMGMGARGLFLLDVSDPARFGEGGGALWEFTEQDDDAIGHVHAPPLLVRLPPAAGAGAWDRRAAALVASGINPLGGGGGALFVLALDKRRDQRWEAGVNYLRIAAGEGSAMLSPPAVVSGPQGEAQHAYAGDLDGNLWHFDLATQRSRRVFTARDARGRAQPIAHAPQIVHGPGGGYLVIFGTGKLLEEGDLRAPSFVIQSLYGIHDRPGSGDGPVRSRAELAERILSGGSPFDITGEALDYFLPAAKRGWYFDLPDSLRYGERAAASPVAADGVVVFQTVMPGYPGFAGEPGLPSSQTGRLYTVSALSGMAVDPLAGAKRDARTGALTAASPLQPLILIKGGREAGPRSPTGAVVTVSSFFVLRPEGGAPAGGVDLQVRREAGRMGWREISNWHDLREVALR